MRGSTPTVEQAAEAADVSRATSYRYFPNQRALLVGDAGVRPPGRLIPLIREG